MRWILVFFAFALLPLTAQLPLPSASGGSGSGSGWVLVETQTASASATLDFTACITGTYDTYKIVLVDILPATNNTQLWFRVSTDGGSSYVATASYIYSILNIFGGAAPSVTFSASDSQILLDNQQSNSTTLPRYSGEVTIYNPANATSYKNITIFGVGYDGSNYVAHTGSGRYAAATAVNAFRILMSSGNITSGTVRCYGVVK